MNRPAMDFDQRLDPPPHDFDDKFVQIGRLECQKHYHAGRNKITRWMILRGKQRLLDARWAYVVRSRNEAAKARRISRQDIGRILATAFPVPTADLSDAGQMRVSSGR